MFGSTYWGTSYWGGTYWGGASPTGNANVRIEWFYPATRGAKLPVEFHVFKGTGGSPDYTTVIATVPYTSSIAGTYNTTISGLVNGTTYAFAVRAYNASGESLNSNVATATADSVGPNPIGSLTAVTIT